MSRNNIKSNMENVGEVEELIEGSNGSFGGGPYMVEKILGIYVGKNCKKYYRVKWVDSWEPEDNLNEACQNLIDEFWSSSVQDETGGEVNRSELKSGQKLIKKEIIENRLSEEINQECATAKDSTHHFASRNVVPTLKADLGSPKPPNLEIKIPLSAAENIKILKEELKSPSEDSSTVAKLTSNNDFSTLLKRKQSDNSIINKNPPKSAPPQEVTKETAPRLLHPSQKNLIRSASVGCSSDTSHLDNSNRKSTNEIHKLQQTSTRAPLPSSSETTVQLTARRSIDSQTQTVEEILKEQQQQQQHDNPNINTSNSNDSTNHESTADTASVLSLDESDIVDLASEEEDVEITFSFSTPPNKRQCLERQLPASTSRVEKRTREKVTSRRRRISEGGEPSPTQNTPLLLHPRSLLNAFPNSVNKRNQRNSTLNNNQVNSLQSGFQQQQQSVQQTGRRQQQMQPRQLNNNQAPIVGSPNQSRLTDRTCNICNHSFPNLTLARQHMKTAHNKTPAPTSNQDRFSLQNRKKSLTSSTNNNNNNFSNNSTVSSSPSRSPHGRSSTGSEVSCSVCFGMFRNNRDLKSHMLLHTEETVFKCEVCLKPFRHKSTLQQHMLIHSDEMPHECKTCGKRFRQQGHLILHMGKHSKNNEGSLSCPYCRVVFTDTNEFRNHTRSHESELPHKCNQCLERFEHKGDLMKHLEGHNEGRPFTCSICKKSFKTKPYLLGHMQMHKSNTQPATPQQPKSLHVRHPHQSLSLNQQTTPSQHPRNNRLHQTTPNSSTPDGGQLQNHHVSPPTNGKAASLAKNLLKPVPIKTLPDE